MCGSPKTVEHILCKELQGACSTVFSCYYSHTMISHTAKIFLIAFAAFAAIQFALLRLFLYWRYPWVDIPMHAVGGAIVGLGVFAARDLHVPLFAHLTKPYRAILVVLFVASVWEVLEYVTGLSIIKENFASDTMLDLTLGLVGGMVGIVIGRMLEDRPI